MFDPLVWLAALVAALLCLGGGYQWGKRGANNANAATAVKGDHKVAAVQATRDDHIEAIGIAAASSVAIQLDDIKVHTDESVPRILTVVVPAVCRDKPAFVVHELANETDRINADIRNGLRQRTTVNAATGAGHGT